MKPDAQTSFTAAQMAKALGVTPRAVLLRLSGVPADATRPVRGQGAKAWSVAALPQNLLADLEAQRQTRGHRTLDDLLLATPPAAWQPPVPWHLIPQAFRDLSTKLSAALAPALARQHELSNPDLMDLARTSYRQTFGHVINDDKLRYLMDRATKRDQGFQHWQRPDLFLDDAAFHQAPPAPALPSPTLYPSLDAILREVKEKNKPSVYDRAYLLDAAFWIYLPLVEQRRPAGEQRALKNSLVEYLHRTVPGLYRPHSAPENPCGRESGERRPRLALRQVFTRKYPVWDKNGRTPESILDQRPNGSGRVAKAVSEVDARLLADTAIACDGNTAQAFRRLHQLDQFTPEFRESFPHDPQNKSHVPEAVRKIVTPMILTGLPSRRGPHHTRMISPKVARDWTNVAPYDFLALDDVTFNHPFAIRDTTGKILIRRGECILDVATRVNYIVHHTLIAGMIDGEKSSFNAWHVRGNILAVHDKLGLPYRGLDLEHNVFAARLIRGDRRKSWRSADVRSFEPGLRHADLGLELHYHHPGTPWTKPIERVIGMVQDRMNCEPGYVGRNERLDKRELVQEKIRAVESGRLTPEEAGILWFEQFRKLLDAVIEEYNREVQNGVMLRDTCGLYLSPEDAFINGICGQPGTSARPAKTLSAQGRARLSTHQCKKYVQDRGIEIDMDGQPYPFWDENLEPYRHRQVLAYHNIECPEVLICSDLQQTHFFPVKCNRAAAMDAPREQLKSMNRSKAKFMARSRVLQSEIKPPIISLVGRDANITQATESLGDALKAATEQHQAEKKAARNQDALLNRRRHREADDLEQQALAGITALESQNPEGGRQ